MGKSKNIQLTIKVYSEDGTPLKVSSIKLNDKLFLPIDEEEDSSLPLEAVPFTPVTVDTLDSSPDSIATMPIPNPFPVSEEYDTLEQYGGKAFYKTFWGNLTYQKIDDNRSKVSFEGTEDVFNAEFEDSWLEPSRVHKCSLEYPHSGRNYFPNTLAVVYSRVIEVLDGKNLIVDFPYNGGDRNNPKVSTHQDGIFFFDNKFAIEAWSNSARRKNSIKSKPGSIYGTLGMPKIIVKPDSVIRFDIDEFQEPPAIHLMWSDAFTGDEHGLGLEPPQSFKDTFGENSSFFHLPSSGRVDVNFEWQFIPSTYSQKVVQYGSPNGSFFNDSSSLSTQYGLKRVVNLNQFKIREDMKARLGFVREGATFSMPNQGYCNGGGVHDGRDIKEFCTYRFEGDWVSKNPNNMKARTSGGLRVEWLGFPDGKLGSFIEMESEKAFRFDDLSMRMVSPNRLEVQSNFFTWFHLASQEWTGGTSAGSEASNVVIDGKRIGLNTNGDFWMVYGDNSLAGRDFSGDRITIFDKIPKRGDIISQDLSDLESNGWIAKVSESVFEIWGWAMQKGDQLRYNGQIYQVKKTQRKWKTWAQFASQYASPDPRLLKNDRRITFTEIELDKGISQELSAVSFEVERAVLEPLLDGKLRSGCSAVWNFGNDAPGHLMYTDYNVNLVMRNIQIHGMIRSTSRPLYSETTQPLNGSISTIPVSRLGSKIWNKGDKLQLVHPEIGLSKEVEVIKSFSGNAGNLFIKPTELSAEFPVGSIVVGLFSLCSESVFDNVYFINEDGTACYSERIDYRPQGLRLRQLLLKNDDYRVKINSGRLSWYSNMNNRFEPEIELTGHPHLVNPKSVVPVILNPIFTDRLGAKFGFQKKEKNQKEIFITSRIVVTENREIHLENSELGSDLTLEGNGIYILDNLKSLDFVTNGKKEKYGFNLRFQDRFLKSSNLIASGAGGKAGLIIDTPYPIGNFSLKLTNWELFPGIFNAGGFQTKQDKSHPEYSNFVQIQKI